ncbi:hypothetical protein POM88_006616 [Heracleum sosnowskyi]|uniref:Uncharacterized protein n=1 Tax=Heracleum sosnowskyi TaxID=360622 RepID=A0AAD8N6P3_9APIA|nr:hypothetical protein POM88_006616 [Heracleum sosnowskyi]
MLPAPWTATILFKTPFVADYELDFPVVPLIDYTSVGLSTISQSLNGASILYIKKTTTEDDLLDSILPQTVILLLKLFSSHGSLGSGKKMVLVIVGETGSGKTTQIPLYLHEAGYTKRGKVGWWAGVSQDHKDPYGHIIHIYPEHGRFVAKSYSPCFLSGSHVHNASKAFPVNGYEFSVDSSEILKKFEQFKKFEIVEDFTDHHFVNDGTSTKKPSKNSLKRIKEEWKILEKDLPVSFP